ncbi:peptidase S1 and S6 chymotrypsin/Hap family protein [Nitzschia inconspicua]|uniref:Peptidase S1 and S6 chymotrypsin/Hap family protein n=1 Tax=Nitzschia inconspicua TaxID=303405 RepID=A0A9K3LVG5_9STRA|nr:peptidase S1 and S6 chymotrypsin/Hap family protein [Nitzschia inconspicua]
MTTLNTNTTVQSRKNRKSPSRQILSLLWLSSSLSTLVVAVQAATTTQNNEQQQFLLRKKSVVDSPSTHSQSTRTLDAIEDQLDSVSLPQHDDNNKETPSKQTRIINGEDVTDPDRYPWFVHMRGTPPEGSNVQPACGGSLIAPDIVLTAAHCEDAAFALVGASTLPVSGTRFDVVTNVRHPNYPQGDLQVNFDIMILQLVEPVPESVAKPITLNWDENFPASTGYPLTIMGFGSILGGPENAGNLQSPDLYLQRAPTAYVAFEDCAVAVDPETGDRFGFTVTNTRVEPWWFCTILNDPVTTATCFGDSGGPVFEEKDGTPDGDLLLGVISGGPRGYCGNPYLPLYNNRISYHKDWIVETGCALSSAPPAEWNCERGGIAPDGPVTDGPNATPTTPSPAETQSTPSSPPSPATTPTTPSPTRSPTTRPTPQPTRESTAPTESLEPTIPQEPSSEPSGAPNNFIVIPPPSDSGGPMPTPTGTDSDNDTDDTFICPICGEGQEMTSLWSVVLVPILGTFTCAELEQQAAAGEISKTQCGIVQVMTSSACGCRALPPTPTVPTIPPTRPPLSVPTTRPPSVTMSPSLLSADCEPLLQDETLLVDVVVSIRFDSKPNETGWYIADEDYNCYRVGIPALAYRAGTTSVNETVFLERGSRYMFVMEDIGGDGLCCGNNDDEVGSYTLSHGDVVLASGQGDFGLEETTFFTVPDAL